MFASSAILIRSTRLTDSSLIVHWFTKEEGLVKTVAKGALRPKSPFAGKLDMFFSGEIEVLRAKKGELHILREVSISHWREGLRRSYDSALLAGYFCQLVGSAVEPGHAEPLLHDLLLRGLDHLDADPPSLRALDHFEKQLTGVLGIWGGRGSVYELLRDQLGQLPASRGQLLERLGRA